MIILILLLPIFIALLLNMRDNSEKEWDNEVKEYRREKCGLHQWSYHPETGKMGCTECGFTP